METGRAAEEGEAEGTSLWWNHLGVVSDLDWLRGEERDGEDD